jgi:hypothetical protein
MRRSFGYVLSLALLCALVTVSFAQQPAKPAAPQYKVFVGTVGSMTPADAAAGTLAGLVVVDKANAKLAFVLTPATAWFDAKGAKITMDNCKQGDEVKVRYKTTPKGNEAVSVRLTK